MEDADLAAGGVRALRPGLGKHALLFAGDGFAQDRLVAAEAELLDGMVSAEAPQFDPVGVLAGQEIAALTLIEHQRSAIGPLRAQVERRGMQTSRSSGDHASWPARSSGGGPRRSSS